MRHRKAGRQFGRNTSHRRAMLRALTANLIAHERIETTDAKAKELRRVAERVITRAKRLGKIAYTPAAELSQADQARRQAAQQQVGRFLRRFGTVQDGVEARKVDLLEKVFVDLAKRFADRPGGYTRIVKVENRKGDNAPMAVIALVTETTASNEAARATRAAASKKKAAEAEAPAENPVAEVIDEAGEAEVENAEAVSEGADENQAAATADEALAEGADVDGSNEEK